MKITPTTSRTKVVAFFTGIPALLLLAAWGGYALRGPSEQAPSSSEAAHHHHPAAKEAEAGTIWTCSMHPQIRLPKPGKCPICGMDLIPLKKSSGAGKDLGRRELAVGAYAAKLLEIETIPVRRQAVEAKVRLLGTVDYDETRLSYITAWAPGRLDRLFVDYTGVSVRKGDHLVSLYSPELLTAQEELLQAVKTVKGLERSKVDIVRETATATVIAAREKLALWGLTARQIADIERRGKPMDHITIYAPSGGIVIHKNAVEGMYVKTGTRIYTIADLSQVWVKLDAYEADLKWLRYGQKVSFAVEAYPGETFTGVIAFIAPTLNQATRTVRIRVNVQNSKLKLKPGMFVRAVVRSSVAAGGKVMAPDMAGKWICPMHPGEVADKAGKCRICGMPLVQTSELGYVTAKNAELPLVIPVTAALITGKRAVVYVQVPGRTPAVYQGREVVLGARAGDFYVVVSGLKEGERVVTRGSFMLDAELQIQAKPSMMTPQGGGGMAGMAGMDHGGKKKKMDKQKMAAMKKMKEMPFKNLAPAFVTQFSAVIRSYLELQQALSQDQADMAKKAARAVKQNLGMVDMTLLAGDAHMAWMKALGPLKKAADAGAAAGDIRGLRLEFVLLSNAVASAVRRFGGQLPQKLVQVHCPMAFNNRGADWVQQGTAVKNPYFGEAMQQCGEVVQTLSGFGKAAPEAKKKAEAGQ